MKDQTMKLYFAGELFSLKHLLGNAVLASFIQRKSMGEFSCILPQTLEQRDTSACAIRDQDIETLIECDVALFNFDGDEIDSGTVAEYMIAKFIDMPTVIVRSDIRAGGDQLGDPWNLMLSNYPRTKVVSCNAMSLFQKALSDFDLKQEGDLTDKSVDAATDAMEPVADEIVKALREVVSQPPVLEEEQREAVFSWVRKMPGSSFSDRISEEQISKLLSEKISKNLL